MVVVLVTGPKCSGKGTFAEVLCEFYNFRHIKFNEYLRQPVEGKSPKENDHETDEISTTSADPCSFNSSFEFISSQTVAVTPEFDRNDDNFCATPPSKIWKNKDNNSANLHYIQRFSDFKKELIKKYDEHIVVTSFRHTAILNSLRSRPHVVTVAVDASAPLRYGRVKQKYNRQNFLLEKFLNLDSNLNYGCQRCCSIDSEVFATEMLLTKNLGCIAQCVRSSDFYVVNNGTLDLLKTQITQLGLNHTRIFRPSFDDQFMATAHVVSSRSNCIRRRVGAVLTVNDRIISTGYNGTPRKALDCMKGGCNRCRDPSATRGKGLHVCLCVHAEANALLQAGMERSASGTLYVTCFPCLNCTKLIIQASIARVVYGEPYDDDTFSANLLKQTTIKVEQYNATPCKRSFLPNPINIILKPLPYCVSTTYVIRHRAIKFDSSHSNFGMCPAAIRTSKRVPYLPLLANLWKSYVAVTPRAAQIHLFLSTDQQLNVVNDHIAFRTVSHPAVNLGKLGHLFEQLGFALRGEYVFNEKHLTARHYEYNGEDVDYPAPKVFISQLELDQMSSFVKETLSKQVEKIPHRITESWELLTYGPPSFDEGAPNFEVYQNLLEESEYAAWFYIYGYVPNHFTISVNHLWRLEDPLKHNLSLQELNNLIEGQQWRLSRPNGKSIQGTSKDLLEQSSTLAEPHEVKFSDGIPRLIPSCYYEFAYRHKDPTTNRLFSGFVTKNADKLFESTNVGQK